MSASGSQNTASNSRCAMWEVRKGLKPKINPLTAPAAWLPVSIHVSAWRRERAQHERGKQGDVVGQHRRAAHPLDRAGKKRQADAVIGERQAAGRGEEAEAVPPRTQKGEPVHVPPERPRAEKWIPKVVWHRSGELSQQVAEKQQDEPHIPEEGNTKAPGRGGACSGAHDRGVMILNVLACRLPRSPVVRKS